MYQLLSRIPVNIYNTITPLLVAIVFLDLFVTWSALWRKELRDKGEKPYTFVGEYYAIFFNDDFIKRNIRI